MESFTAAERRALQKAADIAADESQWEGGGWYLPRGRALAICRDLVERGLMLTCDSVGESEDNLRTGFRPSSAGYAMLSAARPPEPSR